MTTTADDTEIEALQAREIYVASGPAGSERPVMLTIPVYGRHGHGGAAHGALLTKEGALLLLDDLADVLGVGLPRPLVHASVVQRAIRWARRRAAHWSARRALARARAGRLSERELLRTILGDQVPAQRTASDTPSVESAPDESPTHDTPAADAQDHPEALTAATDGARRPTSAAPH